MTFEIRQTAITAIDATDFTYRITTEDDVTALTASIGRVGLLCPPILAPAGGRWRVVCGFRRLAACRCLNWSHLDARRVPEPVDPWRCALWAVAENAAQRALNPVETGRALRLIRRNAPCEKERREALAVLGLPDNHKAEKRFSDLCDFPGGLQRAVARGEVALPTAAALGQMAPEVAETLASLFVALRFGLNKQREVVELLEEIARRERRSLAEVLDEPDLAALLGDANGDRALKGQRLRAALRRRRFPALTAAERRFEVLRRRLPLTPEAQLLAPAGFEGRHYQLTLSFSSRAELARHRATLDDLLAHESLDAILDWPPIP